MSESNFFFQLGSRAAPWYLRARWFWQSMAGSETDRIRAEEHVGACLAAGLRETAPLDDDPEAARWLNWLGRRLTDRLAGPKRRFHFRSLLATEVNALALPGGFIFITRALLDLCRFETDEVAFVLGHEIGHVVEEHAAKRMMNEQFIRIVTARLGGSRGSLGGLAARLARDLVVSGYSRENEFEADAFGVQLAKSAGFSPGGGQAALERLRALHPAGGGGLPFLASHPPLDERIGRAVVLAEQLSAGHAHGAADRAESG